MLFLFLKNKKFDVISAFIGHRVYKVARVLAD